MISTGSQGEPMSALSLMATGDNKRLRIEEGDVVVISAHPIPGNEWSVGRVIDELHRRGAEVVHSGAEAVHVSGHARQGELATLISVARPEAFVPVHGEYRHMVHHAALARATGVAGRPGAARARTATPSASTPRGCAATARSRPATSTSTGRWATSATGCCATARCWPRRGWSWSWPPSTCTAGSLSGEPQIATKGWVHAPEAEELLGEASQVVALALERAMADGAHDVEVLGHHARKALGRFVGDRTRRRPMIVPVVMVV